MFDWTAACQTSFDHHRSLLIHSPVLAYPNFSKDLTLETDASIRGLGAVLAQYQQDEKLHPVSYASRALSKEEENYAITELETLAVVWAVSHIRHLVYGHDVTVVTDHTAVWDRRLRVPSMPGGGTEFTAAERRVIEISTE